ncbi:MAG: hypothetical protein ACREN2_06115 [Candidatus Dormibacteria bacterium]
MSAAVVEDVAVRIRGAVVPVRIAAESVPLEIAGRVFHVRFTARDIVELDRRYALTETDRLGAALVMRMRATVLELLSFALHDSDVDGEPIAQWLERHITAVPLSLSAQLYRTLALHSRRVSDAIQRARDEQQRLDEQLAAHESRGASLPAA